MVYFLYLNSVSTIDDGSDDDVTGTDWPFAGSPTNTLKENPMSLPHDTLVLVADGRKMLFLRNKGDAGRVDLQVEAHDEQSLHKDSDMKTDLAGQSAAPGGSVRGGGTMGEVDYHQQAEDRWARDTAQIINQRALAHEFSALAVIAPPKTLGELRKHWHKVTESMIVMELSKEMTDRPVADIEAMLMNFDVD